MVKPKIASAADIAAKWKEVTPGRASYYEAGAVGAGADWERAATAAASAYKSAVTAADIEQRFKGGIKRAGAAKYDRKVKDVGVGRFGPGVLAAAPDFQAGFEPYVAVIAATELPARKPRGDPSNIDRVKVIATALNKKRLALIGAGATK